MIVKVQDLVNFVTGILEVLETMQKLGLNEIDLSKLAELVKKS